MSSWISCQNSFTSGVLVLAARRTNIAQGTFRHCSMTLLHSQTVSSEPECHKRQKELKRFIGRGRNTLSPLLRTHRSSMRKGVAFQALLYHHSPHIGGGCVPLDACTLRIYLAASREAGWFPAGGSGGRTVLHGNCIIWP